MMSPSGLASPGGLAALKRHCIQRPLLLILPSFSMKAAQGSWNTSVLIFLGSIPGPFQKEPVSLSKTLTLTIQSSFAKAWRTFPALALEQAGFMPQAKKPVKAPLYISSKRFNQEASWVGSSFGIHEYPNSFSLVAFSPYIDFKRLIRYLGRFFHQLTLLGSLEAGVVLLYSARVIHWARGVG